MKLIIIELSVLFSCIALFLSTEYLVLNTDLLQNVSQSISETNTKQASYTENEADAEKRREYLSRHNLSAAIYQSITDEN